MAVETSAPFHFLEPPNEPDPVSRQGPVVRIQKYARPPDADSHVTVRYPAPATSPPTVHYFPLDSAPRVLTGDEAVRLRATYTHEPPSIIRYDFPPEPSRTTEYASVSPYPIAPSISVSEPFIPDPLTRRVRYRPHPCDICSSEGPAAPLPVTVVAPPPPIVVRHPSPVVVSRSACECAALAAQVRDLELRLADREATLRATEATLRAMEAAAGDAAALRQELRGLDRDLGERRAAIARLEAQESRLQNDCAALADEVGAHQRALHLTIDARRADLQALDDDVRRRHKELAAAAAERDVVRLDLEALRLELRSESSHRLALQAEQAAQRRLADASAGAPRPEGCGPCRGRPLTLLNDRAALLRAQIAQAEGSRDRAVAGGSPGEARLHDLEVQLYRQQLRSLAAGSPTLETLTPPSPEGSDGLYHPQRTDSQDATADRLRTADARIRELEAELRAAKEWATIQHKEGRDAVHQFRRLTVELEDSQQALREAVDDHDTDRRSPGTSPNPTLRSDRAHPPPTPPSASLEESHAVAGLRLELEALEEEVDAKRRACEQLEQRQLDLLAAGALAGRAGDREARAREEETNALRDRCRAAAREIAELKAQLVTARHAQADREYAAEIQGTLAAAEERERVRGTLRSSLVTPAGMPLPRILGDQLARQEATIARLTQTVALQEAEVAALHVRLLAEHGRTSPNRTDPPRPIEGPPSSPTNRGNIRPPPKPPQKPARMTSAWDDVDSDDSGPHAVPGDLPWGRPAPAAAPSTGPFPPPSSADDPALARQTALVATIRTALAGLP